MYLFLKIYLSLLIMLVSCTQHQAKKTQLEKETVINKNANSTWKQEETHHSSLQDTLMKRNANESAESFIRRTREETNVNFVHHIIESRDWISNNNVIIFFLKKAKKKQAKKNYNNTVYGFLYVSKRDNLYQKVIIDKYKPEGEEANIKTVFFANADKDNLKELVILCTWKQKHGDTAEGTLYQTFIYDNFNADNIPEKLTFLKNISNHFGIEFEGTQFGKQVTANFKTAKDIKKELSDMGF